MLTRLKNFVLRGERQQREYGLCLTRLQVIWFMCFVSLYLSAMSCADESGTLYLLAVFLSVLWLEILCIMMYFWTNEYNNWANAWFLCCLHYKHDDE